MTRSPVHQLTFRIDDDRAGQGYTCQCLTCRRYFRDAVDMEQFPCDAE